MAKHRLEQTKAGHKTAKTAILAGGIAVGGSLAFAAAPSADATPLTIPNVGTFDVPSNILPPKAPKVTPPTIGNRQEVRGKRALAAAESKIGSPYVYGAAGPNAFDCSGLVYWSYQQAGKTIPRDSYGQLGGGSPVASLAAAKPGDVLIFNGGGHAGIYAGNGIFVHSSTEGVPVQRSKVNAWSLTGIRRY